jgi:hypothetical protein
VEELLSFAAALVALRLAAQLLRRFRVTREAAYAAWGAGLVAYSVASAALAWSSAADWSSASFRVYYLCGGLLAAPLLGCGSLLRARHRWGGPVALAYGGLAVGVALAMPVHGAFAGAAVPAAQAHLTFVPGRLLAVVANSAGTLALAGFAVASLRRRPLGNGLILGGVAVAAAGSGLSGLGVTQTSLFALVAALLLYGGFVAPARIRSRAAAADTAAPASAS